MQDLCWSLTMHCGLCDLAMVADAKAIIRSRGKNYSPWARAHDADDSDAVAVCG